MGFKVTNLRSAFVGLVAALVAFAGSFVALTTVYWFIRPFVWKALYGVAYSAPEFYAPDSGEWLFVQATSFLSAMMAGFACAKWAGTSARWLIWCLVVASILLVGGELPNTSYARQAIYFLVYPLGILCGALLLRRIRARASDIVA